MRKYNCSNPDENPIPHWMIQRTSTRTSTQEEKGTDVPEESDESRIEEDSNRIDDFPPFVYQSEHFFPKFCLVRKVK